jgi:hypothetical protein
LASYWRSGKIAANQPCWSSTQLTIPHYASPLHYFTTDLAESFHHCLAECRSRIPP